MSYETPILTAGGASNQSVYEAVETARHPIGTSATMSDGRRFVYALQSRNRDRGWAACQDDGARLDGRRSCGQHGGGGRHRSTSPSAVRRPWLSISLRVVTSTCRTTRARGSFTASRLILRFRRHR